VSKSFVIETADQRKRLVSFLENRDLPIQVDIGPVRTPRSTSQNSRLWALHALASKETGYAPEELHELMLCRHFGTREIDVSGHRMTVPLKRSSTREKREFREFLDAVETFYASELGVWLGQED
jgi:hypothetical protein